MAMKVGTFRNNPQIAGRGLICNSSTDFEIEGVKAITLDQVRQLNAAGFVQWDSPGYEQKILGITPPPAPVISSPFGNDLPGFPPVFPPLSMPPISNGGLPKTTINFKELENLESNQPANNSPFAGEMPSGFSSGGFSNPNMPVMASNAGPRKIGFLSFATTDKGGHIPEEAKGFNLAAFGLSFWWFIFTSQIKTGLLMLVPVLGTLIAIQGWFFGHQMIWAANPGKWSNWEEYKKSQKIWNILAIVLLALATLSVIGSIIFFVVFAKNVGAS